MRNFFLILSLVICGSIFAKDTLSEEESFFLRRVADFWEEKEYPLVKSEIEDYLSEHTIERSSLFSSYVYSLLGDLYLKENNYEKAISYYQEITTPKLQNKVRINKLQCLYALKNYKEVAKEALNLRKVISDSKEKLFVDLLFANSLLNLADNKQADKKLILLKKLKTRFESFLGTEYETEALESLIKINQSLDDTKSSVETYLALAEKIPDRQEDFLFQAALLETKINKEASINDFKRVWDLQKKRAYDALYNQALLLFELKKFDEVIKIKDLLINNPNSEKALFINFFVGKSFSELKNSEEAKIYLEKFIAGATATEEAKIALLTIIQYASSQEKIDLLNQNFEKLVSLFPGDKEIATVLLERASIYKKQKNYTAAREDLERVLKDFSFASSSEDFIFENAELNYLEEKWDSAHLGFKTLINDFPNSSFCKASWRYYINSSMQLAASRKIEDLTVLEEVLKKFLDEASPSVEERMSTSFTLAQTLFELKKIAPAIEELKGIIKKYPTHPQLADVLLFTAYCYKELNDNDHFLVYAKEATALNPLLLNDPNMLVSFFNSYLEIAQKENRSEACESAANYLFKAQKLTDALPLSSYLWLADYYFSKVKNYMEANWKNSTGDKEIIDYYRKAFILSKATIKNHFKNREMLPSIELELIHLAKLFEYKGNIDKATSILNKLAKYYKDIPSLNWQYKEETFLEQAKIAIKNGEIEKASILLDKVIQNLGKQTYSEALLLKVRLFFAQNGDNISEENRNVVKNLALLKNIFLQKKLETEPLHLEAALEYVDLQCSLQKDIKSKDEKKLFLLTRTKNCFTSQEENSEYFKNRDSLKEKSKIFDAYIYLIDAEIAFTKYIIEKKAGGKADEQKEIARKLFSEMDEKGLILTEYLQRRVESRLRLMES